MECSPVFHFSKASRQLHIQSHLGQHGRADGQPALGLPLEPRQLYRQTKHNNQAHPPILPSSYHTVAPETRSGTRSNSLDSLVL